MKDVFSAIGDFFGVIFNGIEALGNAPNYFYIMVIFIFLVFWTAKMLQHKKDNDEHAPL